MASKPIIRSKNRVLFWSLAASCSTRMLQQMAVIVNNVAQSKQMRTKSSEMDSVCDFWSFLEVRFKENWESGTWTPHEDVPPPNQHEEHHVHTLKWSFDPLHTPKQTTPITLKPSEVLTVIRLSARERAHVSCEHRLRFLGLNWEGGGGGEKVWHDTRSSLEETEKSVPWKPWCQRWFLNDGERREGSSAASSCLDKCPTVFMQSRAPHKQFNLHFNKMFPFSSQWAHLRVLVPTFPTIHHDSLRSEAFCCF